jgi:hypothetical protein
MPYSSILAPKKINQVYKGGGFPEKGISVQVSDKATLTSDTSNLQHETIIIYLAHGLRASRVR